MTPPLTPPLMPTIAVEPHPGNKHVRFLEYVRETICADDPARLEYLLNWMARAVQKPDLHGQIAIVLRGPQDLGKRFFVKTFGELFGHHFLTVPTVRHFSFNTYARDCVVLFVDGDISLGHERAVNSLITEDTLVIERKGVDAEAIRNRVHLIVAANAQWAMPTLSYERRFLVLDVDARHMRDTAYFDAIDTDLKAGGLSNLLHELQMRDLANFDVCALPTTIPTLKHRDTAMSDPVSVKLLKKLRDDSQLYETIGCALASLRRLDDVVWYGDDEDLSTALTAARSALLVAQSKVKQRIDESIVVERKQS